MYKREKAIITHKGPPTHTHTYTWLQIGHRFLAKQVTCSYVIFADLFGIGRLVRSVGLREKKE